MEIDTRVERSRGQRQMATIAANEHLGQLQVRGDRSRPVARELDRRVLAGLAHQQIDELRWGRLDETADYRGDGMTNGLRIGDDEEAGLRLPHDDAIAIDGLIGRLLREHAEVKCLALEP